MSTKKKFVNEVSKSLGLTKTTSLSVVNTIGAVLLNALVEDGVAHVPGLGKVFLKPRPGRQGRNPRTGEAIPIPAGKTVKIRVSKGAKDAIKTKE